MRCNRLFLASGGVKTTNPQKARVTFGVRFSRIPQCASQADSGAACHGCAAGGGVAAVGGIDHLRASGTGDRDEFDIDMLVVGARGFVGPGLSRAVAHVVAVTVALENLREVVGCALTGHVAHAGPQGAIGSGGRNTIIVFDLLGIKKKNRVCQMAHPIVWF